MKTPRQLADALRAHVRIETLHGADPYVLREVALRLVADRSFWAIERTKADRFGRKKGLTK